MTGTMGFWRRQQARFSPRSLLAEGRAALTLRSLRPVLPGRKRPGRKPASTVEPGPPQEPQ